MAARLTPSPDNAIQVVVAGTLVTYLVRMADLQIVDVLNEQPNTATLTLNREPHGGPSGPFYPPAFDHRAFATDPTGIILPTIQRGQDIKIYAGAIAPPQLLFAGEIVEVQQFYDVDNYHNVGYHLSCTDYTRALNRRKVLKSYPTQSASAIAIDLLQAFAAGFTTRHVAANLPALAIDFTFEEMNRALTRLANRIGGYWYVDYEKDLHLFLTEAGDPPVSLVPGHAFADLTFESDLSQVRTRVLVEGMGTTALTALDPGETTIPVIDPTMFEPAGGWLVSGPQRIRYTGSRAGGGGALVGPGASPGSGPTATPIAGAGIEPGAHRYAVTFTTATGESLPSPSASVQLGIIATPTAAPTPGTPTAGAGPDPGSHQYAVTFTTATGETVPGPTSGAVSTTQSGVVPAPAALSPTDKVPRHVPGVLLPPMVYDYQTTFLTATGETTGSDRFSTGALWPVALTNPDPAPYVSVPDQLVAGGAQAPGLYRYYLAFTGAGFESAIDVGHHRDWILSAGQGVQFLSLATSSDERITGRKLYRSKVNVPDATAYLLATFPNNSPNVNYTDTIADAGLGAARAGGGRIGNAGDQIRITLQTSPDPRVTGRRVYRLESADGGSTYSAPRLLVTINNTTQTTYDDNTASTSGNPDLPVTNTTGGAPTCVVPITAIPIGGAGVTGRKLYRRSGGAGFKLLTALTNNSVTTFTDTTPNSGLGAAAPTADTTATNRVALTALPIGNAAVTARKIYRTAADAAQLKLLTTIADNVTTTYTDAAADATLGANVPTLDSSGLQQPSGQVPAGSTSIIVAGTSAFSPTGGWAIVGNGEQAVRYTGITASAITGIPATGSGALTATVPYNSSITVAPVLLGIPASGDGAILLRIIEGQDLNLLIIREDAAAIAALAAIEQSDGVIEHYIQDRRLSAAGATSSALAELELFKDPEIRVRYTTRDVQTRSGRVVTAAIPAPTQLYGDFLIQRVSLTRFHLPGIPPLRTVEASSTRFTFEDVLRRLQLEVSA